MPREEGKHGPRRPGLVASSSGMMQALVVGAGPGGLAVSRELKARGVEHVVLERGEGPGQSWAGVYDSLLLHTGKHLSALPGRSLPRSASLFVPAAD